MRTFLCVLFLILVSCQVAPTRVIETARPEYRELVTKLAEPIVLNENTVILDARSSFDYGLSHVANSQSFGWDKLAESRSSGALIRDLRVVAQRLALSGLDIHTPVVIVGSGRSGGGAEGRLAWSLLYYGFYDVQVASIEVFRKLMTNRPSEPIKNATPRDLAPNEHLEIRQAEFLKLLTDPASRAGTPEREPVAIIDVDNSPEAKGYPGILSLDWKSFYNSEGRPHMKVVPELEKLGVTSRHRVILVSKNGVQSGAACFALLSMGFPKVQNFTDGWSSLKGP